MKTQSELILSILSKKDSPKVPRTKGTDRLSWLSGYLSGIDAAISAICEGEKEGKGEALKGV